MTGTRPEDTPPDTLAWYGDILSAAHVEPAVPHGDEHDG